MKERAIIVVTDEIRECNIRGITYVLSFFSRFCRKEETAYRSGNVHFAWELRINYEMVLASSRYLIDWLF